MKNQTDSLPSGPGWQPTPKQPTLGAVIVNYNYPQFIDQAIHSVLQQNPAFDEVIVVDDGSTDHSLEVIASFGNRIKVIAKPNGGSLSAALAGFQAIATEYVYVLDSDDIAVDGIVSLIRRQLAQSPVKVQFQLQSMSQQGELMRACFPTYAQNYSNREILEDNRVIGFYHCVTTSGSVFRRDALQRLNFEGVNLRDSIDGAPALAMPYLGLVLSVNEVIGYYRIHDKSQSHWGKPDEKVLEFEINRLYRHWHDASLLVGRLERPFGQEEPLLVLERRLMLACLQGQPVIARIWAYVRRLGHANFPFKQRAMLCIWAWSLLLPSAFWRKSLVLARRSPANRPRFLASLVRILTLGRRRPAVPLVSSPAAPPESP